MELKRIFGAKTHQRGAPGWAQPTRARPLSWRARNPPRGPADDPPNTMKSHISRKKSGRKNYRDPQDGAIAKPCTSQGGQIWSPFGAPEKGIFVLRHHQPISITNSMILLTGSE